MAPGAAAAMIVSLPSGVTKRGSCALADGQRGDVHVVVVVVADQNEIDRRQVVEGDAGRD